MNDPVDKKFIIGIQMDLKQFTTIQEALSMKIMTIENWVKHGQRQGFKIKINGNDKWLRSLGGFNNNVTSSYGSAVFVIDLEEEGKVLQVIDIEDKDDPNDSTNYVINSVPASLTPIIPENTS